MTKRVLLANPRGFCAGVDRAIEIVNRALDKFGAPVYVRHEVVHNRFVVDSLREKGAVFVETLDDVPEKCIVIFSAHGVSAAVKNAAANRHLSVFDATCPLVTKVHMEVVQHAKAGRDVVLIGHRGHPEVEGTLGQWDDELAQGRIYLVESVADAQQLHAAQPENIAYVSQTTLSVDDTRDVIEALVTRFPSIRGPKRDDICYATQNRQNAVRALSEQCDLVLVVGSPNSSNSNRLCELAGKYGVPAHLIEDESHIESQWLDSASVIGVTAGASAPEELVQNVLRTLHRLGAQTVKELEGDEETIIFSVPRTLK